MMIKGLLYKAALLTLLCCSTISLAELRPFQHQYDIHYGLIHLGSGHMTLDWVSTQTFNLRFSAKPKGLAKLLVKRLVEQSTLNLHSSGYLRSDRYHFLLKGRDSQNQVILFDYANQIIKSEDNQHQWPVESNIALDRLSFPFAIAHALNQNLPIFNKLSIAGHHHLWEVEIQNLGKMSRTLNGETYDALHIRAIDGSESINLWLDANHQHHPIEIHFKSKEGWTTRYTLL